MGCGGRVGCGGGVGCGVGGGLLAVIVAAEVGRDPRGLQLLQQQQYVPGKNKGMIMLQVYLSAH